MPVLEEGKFFITCNFFPEQTLSYLKYLMTSCHSVHSIPRLLHYIVTLLIAKIVLNCEFKLEILTRVVLSYFGISNMVSRRLLFYLFISKYFFACYLFVIRFFFFTNCYQTIICTFLAVGDNMQ